MADDDNAPVLREEVRKLLEGPNYAHLATVYFDGAPLVAPVRVGLEGDKILVATSRSTGTADNTQRDPRVALSIVDRENPRRHAVVRGKVVERRDDPEGAVAREIARRYDDRAVTSRIVLVIEPAFSHCVEVPVGDD